MEWTSITRQDAYDVYKSTSNHQGIARTALPQGISRHVHAGSLAQTYVYRRMESEAKRLLKTATLAAMEGGHQRAIHCCGLYSTARNNFDATTIYLAIHEQTL